MRHEGHLPNWAGVVLGVGASALLTWLLRQGMNSHVLGVDAPAEPFSVWVMFVTGLMLGLTMLLARRHPLVAAIPALWLSAFFGPPLVGSLDVLQSYPSWLVRFFMETVSPAPFIAIGVLVVSSVASLARLRLSDRRETAVDDPIPEGGE